MKLNILFIFFIVFASFQVSYGQKKNHKISITGTVLDADQKPIANAIILIDGKNTEKFTDSKGCYKIKVKSSATRIGIFTISGGATEENINGRTLINFNLGSSGPVQELNRNNSAGEEEIELGYGTIKKENLTSPVGKIDRTDKQYTPYNSIYDMIRGEVAGVEVKGKSIKIQGAFSYLSSTEPLFVVDGVTVPSIDHVLPQTVKSIEILKGSSASIYGTRGANGVILIKTKSTKNNK
jgi:TonB-dependent starch-binding outer membrane protein SusC